MRPLSMEELMRAQRVIDHIDFLEWRSFILAKQMGHVCGTAICVQLLALIMRNVLLAIGRPVK